MEHTVETLLSHGEGTPDELMHKLPTISVGGVSAPSGASNNAGGSGGGSAHHHDIDADEELARQLAAEDERRASNRSTNQSATGGFGLASAMGAAKNRNSVPPGQRRPMASNAAPPTPPRRPAAAPGRGAPTVLPVDFLRIPGRKYSAADASPSTTSAATNRGGITDHPIASASGPGAMGQMMSDEQLARMLQDELFQDEIRNNPEFSHLAGRRNPRSGVSASGGRGQSTGRSMYSGATGGAAQAGGADALLKGLSDLGDNAKRRFQAFAASWNDPNAQQQGGGSGNRRPLFGGAGSSSQNVTGQSRGNERRGLLSNDLDMEEEELDFVGGGGGNSVEMNDVGGYDKKKD